MILISMAELCTELTQKLMLKEHYYVERCDKISLHKILRSKDSLYYKRDATHSRRRLECSNGKLSAGSAKSCTGQWTNSF